jgi:hypothetical protein
MAKLGRCSLLALALVGLVAILGPIFYFGSLEVYEYLTRSEDKARAAAREMFLKICDRQGLDPHTFRGPDRPSIESDRLLGQYTFVWNRVWEPEEKVYVHVTYLPYDLPYSVSRPIFEQELRASTKP